MSERRQVWETLSQLLKRVEQGVDGKPSDAVLKQLEDEVRKLGKAQFKANVLTEDQSTRLEQALEDVRKERQKRAEVMDALIDERVAAAKNELLETILPALDGVEKAMASGRRYLQVRDRAANASNLTDAQSVLVSPADRAMLAGWLDGLRLVRERLLAILEAGEVTPISTVGHSFDPYLHVAVDTTSEGEVEPGTIVEEERRGYRTPDGVLRYAEVVVYRPE